MKNDENISYKEWDITYDSCYHKWYISRPRSNNNGDGLILDGSEYLCYNKESKTAVVRKNTQYTNTQENGWYGTLKIAKEVVDLYVNQELKKDYLGGLEYEDFISQIKKEATSAVAKHGQFASCHEGYAVIAEEVDEFWDEVKKKESDRDYANMKKELVQIAAMCMKMHDLATIKESEKVCIAAHDAGKSKSLSKVIQEIQITVDMEAFNKSMKETCDKISEIIKQQKLLGINDK